MKSTSNDIKKIYIKMLIVILICSIFVTIFWILEEQKNYSNEKRNLKSEYEESSDNEAKYIVNSVVDYLKFTISEGENDLKFTLKDRTDRLYDIAMKIYDNNKNLSRKELKKIINDAVENIKYDEGYNTYFIRDIDGKVIVENNDNEIDKHLVSTKDENGDIIQNSSISLSESNEEGYIYELWENDKNEIDKKIIYMTKFEPLDYYIGSEEFLNDYISKDTAKIFQWINSIKFGYKNLSNIFIFDYKGNVLTNSSNKNILDKNIWNLQDSRGIKITQKELQVAKKNLTGSFVNYYKTNPDTNIEENKGAYVISIPQLKWVVGAEITYPTIEAFNNDSREKKLNQNISYIIFINIIVFMILIYTTTRFKGKIENHISLKIGEMLVDYESNTEKFNNELLFEVKKCNRKIKSLSEKDKVTGAFSHEYIHEILKKEVEYSRVNYEELSVGLIDIDHFKSINKTYGYDLGNSVLNKVYDLIKENLISPFAIGRYDSNCFLVIMPKTNRQEASEYAEKIRKVIREYQFEDVELSITISVAIMESTGDMPDQIINKCYEFMEEAKDNGGDRIEMLYGD
ncbi:hypothetical protein SH2C18_44940 [Clostridium sediminicola]|uniref:sensor domain-containing diguanylate cyclase n=1 Tax=Clostridium sediminicola TaxID=3114879 RepID=UPI0031F1F699